MADPQPHVVKKHAKFVRQPSSKKLVLSKSISPTYSPSPLTRSPIETDGVEEDYCKLYTRQWPVPDSRALVYILHGFGEHCERYEKFIEMLNENKISVATHDHIGHGQSDGTRVHVDNFDTYVEDAMELIRESKQEARDQCFILFGHSMGGLMATLCMLEDPEIFDAGVLCSPCLMVHEKYNKTALRWMARVISYVAPRFYIPSRSLALDPTDVMADEDARKSYEEDPLVWHYQSRAGVTTAMFDGIYKAQANLLNLKVKCLVQHGSADLVCDPAGVAPFSQIPDIVDLKIYEGAKHALLADTAEIRTLALNDILNFMNTVIDEKK